MNIPETPRIGGIVGVVLLDFSAEGRIQRALVYKDVREETLLMLFVCVGCVTVRIRYVEANPSFYRRIGYTASLDRRHLSSGILVTVGHEAFPAGALICVVITVFIVVIFLFLVIFIFIFIVAFVVGLNRPRGAVGGSPPLID